MDNSKQVGGNHYKWMKMEPTEFIMINEIPFCEGNVIKYVCRHRHKNGAEDLKKAIHYLETILKTVYNDERNILQGRVQQERTTPCTHSQSTGENQVGPVSNHD